jgi:hypothetical protein
MRPLPSLRLQCAPAPQKSCPLGVAALDSRATGEIDAQVGAPVVPSESPG